MDSIPQNLFAILTNVKAINAGYIASRIGPRNIAIPAKSNVDTTNPIPRVISNDCLFPSLFLVTSLRKKSANKEASTIAVVKQANNTAKHTHGAAMGPSDSIAIIPSISCGGLSSNTGE